jgi:23S rRNA (guanosine2251-2'-O)-methyltransferase
VTNTDIRPDLGDFDDEVIDTFSDHIDGEAAPWEGRRTAGGRERPDRRPAGVQRFDKRGPASFEVNGDVWIWGLHAAGAALANPARRIREALLTRNAALRLGLDPEAPPPFVKLTEPREIDQRLPEGAVHQGACVRAAPLEALDISDVIALPGRPLVILDQLTDPQNVGAVFRSAAAFGLGGVVMQTRRAPGLGGALAKAAAGGIETTPEVRAVNLARAIDALTDAGWIVVGLDGAATGPLAEAFAEPGPLAIVLGAEGSGLRPAVANACSRLARIVMPGDMESLNVSNAAAIAFYEASRRRG